MELPKVKHLYKYYAYNENSLSVLINKEIWLANPVSFNDPFDCGIKFSNEIPDESLKKYIKREGKNVNDYFSYKNNFIKQQEETRKEYVSNMGIFCMSEKEDNILMWSHYANEHRGFCIGFARQPDNMFGKIETYKVRYDDNYPAIFVIDSNGCINKSFSSLFLTKSSDWEYEQEWRIIYDEFNTTEPIPSSSISSIAFGLKMPQKQKDTIKKILSGQDVSYKEAIISDDQFKIHFVELPE